MHQMLTYFTLSGISSIFLLEQISIVTMLTIVIVFFLVLLVLGILKTIKLKAENDRLNKITPLESDEDNKKYNDFRNGHLYE